MITVITENLSLKIINSVPILKVTNPEQETVILGKLDPFVFIAYKLNDHKREILNGYELILKQSSVDVAVGEIISCLLSMGVVCCIDEITEIIGHAMLDPA